MDRPRAYEAVAVVGDERGWLHWLSRDGRIVRSRRAHAASVTALAVDDVHIASASEDGTVKLSRASGDDTATTTILDTRDFVTSVAFDGGSVVTAGYDGVIRRIAIPRRCFSAA